MAETALLARAPERLLAAMTLEEKIGQLSLYSAEVSRSGDPVNPVLGFDAPEKRIDDIRAGRVTGLFNVVDPAQLREMQRIAIEESRLGIPLIFGADVIHGFRTAFPPPLAEAASFEPELARRAAEAAAVEASAAGLHWTFAPGADLCRDARWGRAIESHGEDPLLCAAFAAAKVRGFQGETLADPARLMATVKHFAGYGAPEAGLDYSGAELSPSTFANVYLPPYRAAVEAGAGAVMTGFHSVDGIPATAHRALIEGVLRGEWGFEGFTVSDYNSDRELIAHGLAENPREAARLCMLAGLDMCMASGLYAAELPGLVEDGAIDIAMLDRAVLRILAAKQALGLFDNPYRGLGGERGAPHPLAREIAARCPVLLKNRGVLPLAPQSRVALIGPFARDHAHLNGAWAIFADNGQSVNLEQGLTAAPEIGALTVEPGSGIEAAIEGGIAAACAAAASADIVVLALGEGQHMSGESRSRADPSLPAAQLALARAVCEIGKPVVVLLRAGRPLVIPELAELADALLVTWFLGAETGHALAALLTGRASPSGRLPMSFPRAVGQIPIYHAHPATGRPAAPGPFTARYIDCEPGPLFPFGFGLGYGRAEYGPTSVDHAALDWDATLTVSCHIAETSGADIDEVAQLYIRDIAASRVRPVRELKGFRKVAIPANGQVEIAFTLTRADLAFHNGTRRIAEPGAFEVWIAPHAEGGTAARFTLETAR